MVMAVGISRPPIRPCPVRPITIVIRSVATPHRTENPVNAVTAINRSVLRPRSLSSQALSGMTMISATRNEVAIQVPSVTLAPISPWMTGRAELTIETSSVARSAPRAPAATAIHAVASARSGARPTGRVLVATINLSAQLREDRPVPPWRTGYPPSQPRTFRGRAIGAPPARLRLQFVP